MLKIKDSRKSNNTENDYDVIVIGAGHAGCEAAYISSLIGTKTLLLTINMDAIALMPCNNSIGGPGRGQLVREIDAIGGVMAKVTDINYIHSRRVNISRGPALRTSRALVDKKRYSLTMKKILENQDNLQLRQGLVVKIKKNKTGYTISSSDGSSYKSKSVVIATGTFLNGKIFWGAYQRDAGRHGEINSVKFAESLKKMGYGFSRLRTETPPRIDGKSIDLSILEKQEYDKEPEMFSYENFYDGRSQLNNYITYLEKDCIDFILKNIKKTSVVLKSLNTKNPKYCPAIEEKINIFKSKEKFRIFIQPEGKDTTEMYLNGLFTTLPEEIQETVIKKIKGLEKAIMTRPGYGIEYDCLLPHQIKTSLESKTDINLFFAGQINGTTGYEEAAAQGIIAGINASLGSLNKNSVYLKRCDGYTGILINDIVLKGVSEPYRMLTSRNEFRIFHRHDNADYRMLSLLNIIGNNNKAEKIENKYKKIDAAVTSFKKSISQKNKSFLEDLRQDRINPEEKINIMKRYNLKDEEYASFIINIKYDEYMNREKEKIRKLTKSRDVSIPLDIDYKSIKNLSNEAVKNLCLIRPETIGQAEMIEGVRPTDIMTLLLYIKNVSRETI